MDQFKERDLITVTKTHLEGCETENYPYNITDFNEKWSIDGFRKNFRTKIIRECENEIEIDLIGIEAPIVNAFRRILLAEVPTMAIDKVFIYNNTSILQDDFLAHRLGLIPIKADPRLFEMRSEGDDEGTPQDTIELRLKVKCVRNPDASKDTTNPNELYINRNVYSGHIEWVPLGNQLDIVKSPIKPVNDKILIAVLSLGQEIDIKMHCVKGIGRDHAKFSPVATASYRLLPKLELLKPVTGEAAFKLQKCFSKGVIEVEEVDGLPTARVANARLDTLSRNHYAYSEYDDIIKTCLVKDHFIFTIESTGILPAKLLLMESIEILAAKCRHYIEELKELLRK